VSEKGCRRWLWRVRTEARQAAVYAGQVLTLKNICTGAIAKELFAREPGSHEALDHRRVSGHNAA
jgi:hypothetical protein